MGLAATRLASFILAAGGWVLAGIRTTLDLIGWSTAPDDVGVAMTRVEQFLTYIAELPWWVPWGFALISTLWLIWVSWPRPVRNASPLPVRDVKEVDTTFRVDAAFLARTLLIRENAVWRRGIEDDELIIEADMHFFNGSGFPVIMIGEVRGSAILRSPLPHSLVISDLPAEPVGYPGYGSFSVWLKLPRNMVQAAIAVAESPASRAVGEALQLPRTNAFGVILEDVFVKFEALTTSGPVQFFARLPHSIEIAY